ncbi:MAG TPA: RNA polymerase sigma factor SigJ [Actinophytocola sp.]|nr:RNA polymerase sigma factor SigJ [Actinophytocola sp.]
MTGGTAAEFEEHRGRLFGLAYRLLGSADEAEDVVQDAFLRWAAADRGAIDAPGGWLAKVVTNLCLNRLTSARARRESYVGPWLPEPVLTGGGELGPLDTVEQRDLVSLGLLRLMETLSPTERAVFVLREAFGYSHREIAGIVSLSEANSRQLHARARRHLARPGTRRPVDRAGWRALVERFLRAAAEGDLPALEAMLAADVTSLADGGGRIAAARKPVAGRARVAQYLCGAFRVGAARLSLTAEYAEVNGAPAALGRLGDEVLGAVVLDVAGGEVEGTGVEGTGVEGAEIVALHIAANPGKLRFAGRQLSHPAGLPGS